MPNFGIAKVSIPEKSQFKALEYEMPEIELDRTHTNKAIISIGGRMSLIPIGTIQVLTSIEYHIVNISTPFLFYLKDIDIFNIILNNITNQLICQNCKSIRIFSK